MSYESYHGDKLSISKQSQLKVTDIKKDILYNIIYF